MEIKFLKVICVEECYISVTLSYACELNSEWYVHESDWYSSNDVVALYYDSTKYHISVLKNIMKTIEEVRILKLNEIFDE